MATLSMLRVNQLIFTLNEYVLATKYHYGLKLTCFGVDIVIPYSTQLRLHLRPSYLI
jgi:hypothetical protein